MTPKKAATTIQRIADSGIDIPTSDYRALADVANWLDMQAQQNEDIFSRMTPELVSAVLVQIAERVRGENPDAKPEEMDIIHLRQIADWLEAQQSKEAAHE